MKFLRFLCVIAASLVVPISASSQFIQSSPNPLTATTVGNVIDESTGGATVHMLNWTITGSPTSCTIAIETSTTLAGTFSTMGSAQSCQSSGSVTVSGIKAIFVRINLIAFAGAAASIAYTYTGTGTVGSAQFADANLWAKLDALRAVEALKHGINKIDHCPLFVPGPTSEAVPYPTDQEFQLYSEHFGSSLAAAASFGDSGANGVSSAQNGIQTEVLAQVRFESEHFFYDWRKCISHRPTFSFGGAVGLTPALVLENLSSTTATITNPDHRPMFQDAFGWNLGPRLNVVTSHNSQFSAFVNLGQNYLLSQVSSFKQGSDTVNATPVGNQVGQSAMFWESGIDWKMFNTDVVNAYINKTDVLDPPFEVSVGYRNDARFKRAGDIASFINPQAYAFFRFNIGLNKIVNWNSTTVDPGKGYTFKFGVDYERRLGDSRMPNATRYYVSANFDVMQVFKPSTQGASQPAPQVGQPQQQVPKAPHAVF